MRSNRFSKCRSLIEKLEWRTMFAAPVANPDLLSATANTALTFNYLTLNDTDADGDVLSITATGTPAHGTLVSNGSGSYTYTPTAAYTGKDSFTYTVSDGTNSVTGTANVIVSAAMDAAAARTTILNGVTTLADPNAAAEVIAYGPQAYSIASDANGKTVLAGATWGAGKVLAMNDHQFLDTSIDTGTTTMATFYQNGISWLGNSTSKAIKIVTFSTANQTYLTGKGYTNVVVATTSNLSTQLTGASVFFAGWLGSSFTQANLDIIANFVRGGGGLWLAEYGQGYTYWWTGPMSNAPGNRLLREAGIAFGYGTSIGLTVTASTNNLTQEDVLNMISQTGTYTTAQQAIGARMMDEMYDSLASTDTLYARMDQYFWTRVATISPTPTTPVSDPFQIALLNHESDVLAVTPAAQVTKHRTADATYGVVPAAAPRITKTVTIDTSTSRWHATGMYAAPGELVTVTVPSSLVGKGYTIEINAHTDTVARSSLERMPYVHRSYIITSTTMQVACAFGGSIFINFGGDAYSGAPNLGSVSVTIANAVEQPYFVLGQNTDADWNNTLRANQAPFAVLVSDNLIVTLPKSQIESANLTTPTALMTFWNNVVIQEDWLAARPTPRKSPEMINVDVQQSAGSAHSGYPIQAYQKYWDNMADASTMLTYGSWGSFHELGHNHQRGWWTFASGTEVTVNIFANYVNETVPADAVDGGGWGWGNDSAQTMTNAVAEVNNTTNVTFETKSQYPFYFQLADGFGWNEYRNVLQSYETDNVSNPSALPVTNTDEKDQWLIRWSKEVGYDLTYYMSTKWKLEVSAAALSTVAALGLPSWAPLYLNMPAKTGLYQGTSKLFDVAGAAMSLDGTATITNVSGVSHGTLTLTSAGKYTYTPTAGYIGADAFTVTLQSSQGNSQTFTVNIAVNRAVGRLDYYTGISGSTVATLTSSTKYINNTPDQTDYVTTLEAPTSRGDNYGQQLQTYILPTVSGAYTFYIASDDNSELWLSTTSSAANKVKIATVGNYTSSRAWTTYTSQKSAAITLVAGQRYYLQALQKEGTGGDNLAVGWSLPGSSVISVIGSDNLRWGTNDAPTIVTGAAPSVSTTTASTVNLSALANDDDGAAFLSYTWSATGPASVAYSSNGANASQNTTATFTKAGTYNFTLTATDKAGQTVTSTTSVVIAPNATSFTVVPGTTTLSAGSTLQFGVNVIDQFGFSMANTLRLIWTITSGGGSLDPNTGLYVADATSTSATIEATDFNLTAAATITIAGAAPSITSVTAGTVTGKTSNLSVVATDDAGESNLTYTWTTVTAPSGAAMPRFSTNGNNAAKNAIATFAKIGSYVLRVTVSDTSGQTATSTVNVSISQVLTSIIVSPNTFKVTVNTQQQFKSIGYDQFGVALTSQPAFTWASTAGTVTATGLFTAGSNANVSTTISASSGIKTGSATITTRAAGIPLAPGTLTVKKYSATTLGLSWRDNSTDETSFEIQYGTGNSSSTVAWTTSILTASNLGAVSTLTYNFASPFTTGKTYYFRVRAINASGSSSWSSYAMIAL